MNFQGKCQENGIARAVAGDCPEKMLGRKLSAGAMWRIKFHYREGGWAGGGELSPPLLNDFPISK